MNITRILRIIHRDLGFLVVGITLVYGISGIYLNHMDGKDPAFHKEEKTIHFPTHLTENELSAAWHADKNLPTLNKILKIDENRSRLLLDGGIGVYNAANGNIDYDFMEEYVKSLPYSSNLY